MAIRFNKRITLLPWLKANVGKNGVSLTIGPKGKTLNIGSTGVSVNVNMGQGVTYNKRLITWKKLSALSHLGLGGAAATQVAKKGRKAKNALPDNTEVSLDEAIRHAEERGDGLTPSARGGGNATQEQGGCSWGCAAVGCLTTTIIVALLAVIVYLLVRQGSMNTPPTL